MSAWTLGSKANLRTRENGRLIVLAIRVDSEEPLTSRRLGCKALRQEGRRTDARESLAPLRVGDFSYRPCFTEICPPDNLDLAEGKAAG